MTSKTQSCVDDDRRSGGGTDLLWLQVADDGVDVVEDLVDEGHHLAHLNLNKMAPALLGDLDEGVTRHVLHAVVGLCVETRRRRNHTDS